jgi:indolepyruvate ferredoxin oxidoreductase
LVEDYKTWIADLVVRLADVDYKTAVAIAALPDMIRGYGPVKERNVAAALAQYDALFAQLSPHQGTSEAA